MKIFLPFSATIFFRKKYINKNIDSYRHVKYNNNRPAQLL